MSSEKSIVPAEDEGVTEDDEVKKLDRALEGTDDLLSLFKGFGEEFTRFQRTTIAYLLIGHSAGIIAIVQYLSLSQSITAAPALLIGSILSFAFGLTLIAFHMRQQYIEASAFSRLVTSLAHSGFSTQLYEKFDLLDEIEKKNRRSLLQDDVMAIVFQILKILSKEKKH